MTAPAFARLRSFARRERGAACELCARELVEHAHLWDRAQARLRCVCRACETVAGAASAFGRLPREVRRLATFVLSEADWQALAVPVRLVYFTRDAAGLATACYPSPAGPVVSRLSDSQWSTLTRRDPALDALEPEVQALLVCQLESSAQAWIVPLDRCLELAALVRGEWRGLRGGPGWWPVVERFLSGLEGAPEAASC